MRAAAAIAADHKALIDAIALKAGVDLGAEVVRQQGAVAIRYPEPLEFTWPRTVAVSLEILGVSLGAVVAAAASFGEPHVGHAFGCDIGADAAAIDAAGYDRCWNTQTLALDLDQAPLRAADGFSVERVEREAQLAELNALEPDYPSYLASLGRPEFVDLLGRRDGRAVAKGRIVCASPNIAYVADMFTELAARGAGCGSAMLSALHAEARRRGLARAVLIPSRTAAETGFYEKNGYRRVSLDAVLLTKA